MTDAQGRFRMQGVAPGEYRRLRGEPSRLNERRFPSQSPSVTGSACVLLLVPGKPACRRSAFRRPNDRWI